MDSCSGDNKFRQRSSCDRIWYAFDTTQLSYQGSSNKTNVYYNPNTVKDEYWKIDRAVFSVGEFWLVQPTYNINTTSESIFGETTDNDAQINFLITLILTGRKCPTLRCRPCKAAAFRGFLTQDCGALAAHKFFTI